MEYLKFENGTHFGTLSHSAGCESNKGFNNDIR